MKTRSDVTDERSVWDIPELRAALKIVLKFEIQCLLEKLARTGEESVVITASKNDGTASQLGSHKGEKFLEKKNIEEMKKQFLCYCNGETETDGDSKKSERESTGKVPAARTENVIKTEESTGKVYSEPATLAENIVIKTEDVAMETEQSPCQPSPQEDNVGELMERREEAQLGNPTLHAVTSPELCVDSSDKSKKVFAKSTDVYTKANEGDYITVMPMKTGVISEGIDACEEQNLTKADDERVSETSTSERTLACDPIAKQINNAQVDHIENCVNLPVEHEVRKGIHQVLALDLEHEKNQIQRGSNLDPDNEISQVLKGVPQDCVQDSEHEIGQYDQISINTSIVKTEPKEDDKVPDRHDEDDEDFSALDFNEIMSSDLAVSGETSYTEKEVDDKSFFLWKDYNESKEIETHSIQRKRKDYLPTQVKEKPTVKAKIKTVINRHNERGNLASDVDIRVDSCTRKPYTQEKQMRRRKRHAPSATRFSTDESLNIPFQPKFVCSGSEVSTLEPVMLTDTQVPQRTIIEEGPMSQSDIPLDCEGDDLSHSYDSDIEIIDISDREEMDVPEDLSVSASSTEMAQNPSFWQMSFSDGDETFQEPSFQNYSLQSIGPEPRVKKVCRTRSKALNVKVGRNSFGASQSSQLGKDFGDVQLDTSDNVPIYPYSFSKSLLNAGSGQEYMQLGNMVKCLHCMKLFTKLAYENHKDYHNRPKKYVCRICGRGFMEKYAINVHLRIHNNERPFGCAFCDKKFFRKHHAQRHEKTAHFGENLV